MSNEKIHASHLERAAYIYVRQSTSYQVQHNVESKRRQYALENRARELGFTKVVVIDDDLGRSGTGSVERPGFGRLLAAVCEGTAGAVLALEASRLARNNRDWQHLIDLCALSSALLIDHDGIYDPRRLNDRLLLGLKGTMSEFEIGLIRQRAQEALREMVQRGDVLTEVPVGFVRSDDNRCEMTADLQVQEAIRGVFRKFRELGTARQVLLWYQQEQVPLPTADPGGGGREITWRLPVYGRILKILQNPTYAGAFAYGRRKTRVKVVDGRARKSQGHRLPQEDWPVLIKDHHPGYISWEEYERNQSLLEKNIAMRGGGRSGSAKRGPALLAGLLRCRRCGRMLHVSYSGSKGNTLRYNCRGANINHGGKMCISFAGPKVDRAVAETVVAAIQPAGIKAAVMAHEQAKDRADEKRSALLLALEKARYEVQRAKRQYDAVDPDNRLVASELERRWNDALQQVADLELRLEEPTSASQSLSDQELERLQQLGQDVALAWEHEQASVTLKKRILRTILEEIVVDVHDEPAEVHLLFHWAGGVHTELRVAKNRTGHHGRCTDRKVVDLVRDLAKVCKDAEAARVLNRLGYVTGAGNSWTEVRVRSLRCSNKIPVFVKLEEPEFLTMQEAALELGVSASTVRRMIERRILPAQQVVRYAPWVIQHADLELPQVVAAVETVRSGGPVPRSHPGQTVIPFESTT